MGKSKYKVVRALRLSADMFGLKRGATPRPGDVLTCDEGDRGVANALASGDIVPVAEPRKTAPRAARPHKV